MCKQKSGCWKENCRGTHTLLHRDEVKEFAGSQAENKTPEESSEKSEYKENSIMKNFCTTTNTNLNSSKRKVVTLPVKKVDVQNGHDQRVKIHGLEDSGSQVTLVTSCLVESLGLKKR